MFKLKVFSILDQPKFALSVISIRYKIKLTSIYIKLTSLQF
jgi:hypothetical protein